MSKGKETIIKMRLKPNTQYVDAEYILKSLLNLSAKEKKADLVPAAKEIITLAATRGDEGLYSEDWEKTTKELNITQSQYFYILKILKNAGIIYKSKGRFYISKTFVEHLRNMTKTMDAWLTDLKVY